MEENEDSNEKKDNKNDATEPSKSLEKNIADTPKVTVNNNFSSYSGKVQDFMGYWWNDMSEIP